MEEKRPWLGPEREFRQIMDDISCFHDVQLEYDQAGETATVYYGIFDSRKEVLSVSADTLRSDPAEVVKAIRQVMSFLRRTEAHG